MKKFTLLLICVFTALNFLSCKKETFPEKDRLSQLRENLFYGENDEITVNCYPETRENPIENDGAVGEKENLFIFKVTFKNQTYADGVYKITFKLGDKSYEGTFEYKPISNNLQCSVKVEKLCYEDFFINFTGENCDLGLTLTARKNKSTINYTDAVKKVKETDETAKRLMSSDNYEMRIRLIDNDGYDYWFIGVTDGKNSVSFLIDGEDGEILAKKDLL